MSFGRSLLLYVAYRPTILNMDGDTPKLGIQEFREGLRARIDAALERGEHTVVTRAGREVAELVPRGELEQLESLRAAFERVRVLCAEHVEVRQGDTLQRTLLPEQVLYALYGRDALPRVTWEADGTRAVTKGWKP